MSEDKSEEQVIPIDRVEIKVIGRCWDHIIHKDGREEYTPIRKNAFVLSGLGLIAGAVGNVSGFNQGLTFHALGEGLAAWDTGGFPVVNTADTTLLKDNRHNCCCVSSSIRRSASCNRK